MMSTMCKVTVRRSAVIDRDVLISDVFCEQRRDSGKECYDWLTMSTMYKKVPVGRVLLGWLVMPATDKAENGSTCAEFVTIALKHTSVKEQVTLYFKVCHKSNSHHSL